MFGGLLQLKPVVKNLLVLNIIMFVLYLLVNSIGHIDLNILLGLYFYKSDDFKSWQILTHMFMHGGFMHIFMNMWALVLFGQVLESVWGPKRFLIYYTICGLGAALTMQVIQGIQYNHLHEIISPQNMQYLLDKNYDALTIGSQKELSDIVKMKDILWGPTVGASGAIFGLLLAFGILFPNTPLMFMFIPIPIKAKYFIIGYGLVELYLAVMQYSSTTGQTGMMDNVAHVAHLGGMIFGYILIRYWRKTTKTLY
jgi:membrane associated rhomboid family serine protease